MLYLFLAFYALFVISFCIYVILVRYSNWKWYDKIIMIFISSIIFFNILPIIVGLMAAQNYVNELEDIKSE